jgi:glycerate kinase
MMNGIDLVIKYSNMKKFLKNTNLLITGEGKIDHQSLSGKVVGSLVEIAKKNKIPMLLIAGTAELNKKSILNKHPIIQLMDPGNDLVKTMKNSKQILLKKTEGYFLQEV